jgi:hypothetical protein
VTGSFEVTVVVALFRPFIESTAAGRVYCNSLDALRDRTPRTLTSPPYPTRLMSNWLIVPVTSGKKIGIDQCNWLLALRTTMSLLLSQGLCQS